MLASNFDGIGHGEGPGDDGACYGHSFLGDAQAKGPRILGLGMGLAVGVDPVGIEFLRALEGNCMFREIVGHHVVGDQPRADHRRPEFVADFLVGENPFAVLIQLQLHGFLKVQDLGKAVMQLFQLFRVDVQDGLVDIVDRVDFDIGAEFVFRQDALVRILVGGAPDQVLRVAGARDLAPQRLDRVGIVLSLDDDFLRLVDVVMQVAQRLADRVVQDRLLFLILHRLCGNGIRVDLLACDPTYPFDLLFTQSHLFSSLNWLLPGSIRPA